MRKRLTGLKKINTWYTIIKYSRYYYFVFINDINNNNIINNTIILVYIKELDLSIIGL